MRTLVTGGAKRLGAELCLSLAKKGHSLVVHYNQSYTEALEVVSHCQVFGVQAAAIQGDFSTTSNTKEFIGRYLKQFPDTNILINNVGDYLMGSALQTSVEDWMRLFQVNLHAPLILSQALAPTLIQHRGHIINIGVSGLMRHATNIYATAYMLSKESLWGLTRVLARELAPDGVKVNMVSPGMLDISIDLVQFIPQLPMQRPASCSEVCRVVNFLLDPASDYITGQNIEIAGGFGLS